MFWDQGEMNLPGDRSIVLSFASKATTEFNASPETGLAVDFTDISQGALKAERLDAHGIADVKVLTGATGAAKDVGRAAGRAGDGGTETCVGAAGGGG